MCWSPGPWQRWQSMPSGSGREIAGFGALFAIGVGDLRIGIVAGHALVGDGACGAGVIGAVVAGIHGEGAAVFGVPAERELLERAASGAVQVGFGVIAGAEDEIDLLLFDVGLAAVEAELPAPLEDAAGALDHGEVAGGRRVVVGLVRAGARRAWDRRSAPCRSSESRRRVRHGRARSGRLARRWAVGGGEASRAKASRARTTEITFGTSPRQVRDTPPRAGSGGRRGPCSGGSPRRAAGVRERRARESSAPWFRGSCRCRDAL